MVLADGSKIGQPRLRVKHASSPGERRKIVFKKMLTVFLMCV